MNINQEAELEVGWGTTDEAALGQISDFLKTICIEKPGWRHR